MKFKEFLTECREKDVFKNLSIYLVSSWLLLQVFSVTWEPLGLPKISLSYLLLILLIGFPLYLYLLWKLRIKKLQITPGVDPRKPIKGKVASSKSGIEISSNGDVIVNESKYRSSFRRMYFTFLLFIGAVVVFSSTLIIKANFLNVQDNAALGTILDSESSNKIAVLKFENNTTNQELDVVGKMAVDWIMHGITQNKVGQVISPKIVDDYAKVLKSSILPSQGETILKEYLKPSKVITGTYYLSDGKLLIQCSILDQNMDKTLISFKAVSCNPDSPLDCIEALKQRILGYLVTQENNISAFEETPPNFEAYQYWLDAQSQYSNTDSEYLKLLNAAIASDSNFFTPKVDRLEYYYNIDQFATMDSLYQELSKETSTNKRQTNLLNLYQSLLQGDNRNAYKYFLNQYNFEPFDLENNSTAMVLALQYVNKPEDLEAIFKVVSMQDMDLDKCLMCDYRNYTMALALMDLDRPQEALDLLEPYNRRTGHELVKEALIRAYATLGQTQAVADLITNIKLTSAPKEWYKLSLFSGKEFLRLGLTQDANTYFDAIIAAFNAQSTEPVATIQEYFAQALYYKEEYAKAAVVLEQLLGRGLEKSKIAILWPLQAMATYKTGDTNKAKALITEFSALKDSYNFGQIDYGIAQYYAAIGDSKNAMDNLLKAIASGNRYTPSAYTHDIHFQSYLNTQAFDAIMKFWH